ncbi:MAG TPA: hypothetical protein VNA13_00720 [Xanthomonadales bacterium]|nr:hypothetical protein [Xanthomonadales bacterium]
MKKKSFIFIGISAVFLAVLPHAFAYSTVSISSNGEGATSSVDVTTNTGNNTVCVNGNCTTSQGSTGKSTVCINGKCTTSDGDIKAESEDGSAKVNIKNNSSSVKVEQKSDSKTSIQINQESLGASIKADTDEEAAKKKIEEEKKKAQKKIEKAKKEAEKDFDLQEFVEHQLEFLRDLVTFKFLFGDK